MATNQHQITDPAAWWRVPSFVTDRVAVSGDLDTDDVDAGRAQLAGWVAAGITDIVDLRGEWSDEAFVARHAPGVAYHWIGTDDDGHGQSDEWFTAGVTTTLAALADPSRKVMIHCHMGVNRAPSMAFAVLLTLGHDPVDALAAIRTSRPIAATLYAEDAIVWWHRRSHSSATAAARDLRRVRTWLDRHPLDVSWVIDRIRHAEAA